LTVDYFFLDRVPWEQSQGLYHAAAYLGREALFVLRPATPYICLGFHQDAQQEIELDFARTQKLPVFRREVGGGAVYLDSGQLFYQLILHKEHPQIPTDKVEFYRRFLEPVVETYRDFGVNATFKPVNDIVANGRKVSGNGAAEINDMVVLVGNFILDFNYEMMSKSLRVPSEKFRDKVYKTLTENLSTFRRETGDVPDTADLAADLTKRFRPLLGPLIPKELDAELLAKADEIMAMMHTSEWLLENDRRRSALEQVKIREGVYVIQKVVKTPGGLVRVMALNIENTLHDIHFSGDFFFYPANLLPALELALEGVAMDHREVTNVIQEFFQLQHIESPGVRPADFATILVMDDPV
jgi:lipoate---protein ligase